MKQASVHLIYSAIILVLLVYIARLATNAGPELNNAPASTTNSDTQLTESSFASDEPMAQQFTQPDAQQSTQQGTQSDEDAIRQRLSDKAQHIETLQARLNALTETANAIVAAQQAGEPAGQQEAERDAAFASAAQTAQSDDVQQRLETSIYNLDNSPHFETLDVECRGDYCNIEVSFENQDDARDFMMYQERRIFDQAEVRIQMTRAEARDSRVIIKADLAPLTED